MANKYPRKNRRKKLKWYDPFKRNKPVEIFTSHGEEPVLSGVSKNKRKKRSAKVGSTNKCLEQELPKDFKRFLKTIKGEPEIVQPKDVLFTPAGKKDTLKSKCTDGNSQASGKKRKEKKVSSVEQWRRDVRKERKLDRQLDFAEKEYFEDQVQLHERVDAPPLDLKAPVATLRFEGVSTVPSTPSSKFKSLSLSAKKLLSSVKKSKGKSGMNAITDVRAKDATSGSISPEDRERVVKAYRELKFQKRRQASVQIEDSGTLTTVEI